MPYKLQADNNACQKRWRAAHPGWQARRMRVYDLMKKFGMSPYEFDDIVESQNRICPVCEKKYNNERKPCVDHDHSTGKVRTIICNKCNLVLGYAYDDPGTLNRAASYLNNFSRSVVH